MRERFGTAYLEQYNQADLFEGSKSLLPALFSFNIKDFSPQLAINPKLDDIMDLLEIVKFGKEKYPYLLTLHFNSEREINQIAVWNDPHYEDEDGISTAFKGEILAFGNLVELSKNPKYLSNLMNSLLSKSEDFLTVCLAGTRDSDLIIGLPNNEYFNKQKPHLVINNAI
jgi:hypothetical protein